MLDLLKRLSEVIPFLEPYPGWTKMLVGGWVLLSAVLLLSLLFAPRKTQQVEPFRLSGRVVSATGAPIPAAAVELSLAGAVLDTVTDSEGYFGIEAARPATIAGGRIRIAAAGHRSYDRVIQVQSDSRDLGSFTLQSDSVSQATASEDPAVVLERRQQQVLEFPPEVAGQYKEIINSGNAGVTKLLSDASVAANRAALQLQGEGRYYSFLRRTHEYGYGSDIKFENGNFSTGFAGLDYGYFLNVGDVPFAELARATDRPPSSLPQAKRAAWDFMWTYSPPKVTIEVRRAQRDARNRVVENVSIAERAAAVPGNSYLLRSINFDTSDLLVALRAERLTSDGSIVVVWKILKTFDTPVASGPEPQI